MDWDEALGGIEEIKEASQRFTDVLVKAAKETGVPKYKKRVSRPDRKVERLIGKKRKIEGGIAKGDSINVDKRIAKRKIIDLNSEVKRIIMGRQAKEEEKAVRGIKANRNCFSSMQKDTGRYEVGLDL